MTEKRPTLIQTDDGSYSLLDPERQLHYRSHHGARTESTHVFLEGTGIIHRPAPWQVLELGLGGAFNFLNTASHFLARFADAETPSVLSYHVVEWVPIDPALLDESAYDTWSAQLDLRELVQRGLAAIQTPQAEASHVQLHKDHCQIDLHIYRGDWRDVQLPALQVDAYYHDPFGPSDNPPSWERDCFAWARQHMAPTGLLATYAAASRVRKAMAEADLYIAKAPGSGRKREMTLASPTAEALAPRKLIRREKYLRQEPPTP